MFKKVIFTLGAFVLVVLAFVTISSANNRIVEEPESYQSLYGLPGEERDNGDDEFLLPVSSDLK